VLGLAGERDRLDPTSTARRSGSCGLGRRAEPRFAEVGGVGEAGGVAADDPDPGAAITPAGDLLDAAVVQTAEVDRLSSA
jgi:hypothetical protein